MLLPSGVAATPAEVDAYLTSQQGLSATAEIAAIAAELGAGWEIRHDLTGWRGKTKS